MSDLDNTIHPGVHTWDARSYAGTDKCDQSDGLKHSILEDGQTDPNNFREGEKWSRAITLGAGESQTYTIELDLNKKGMTKDWSFTAWGENGPVKVNVSGKEKHHWPLVKREDSLLPADEREISGERRSAPDLCSVKPTSFTPSYEPHQCDFVYG